jgi:hypothetical protein
MFHRSGKAEKNKTVLTSQSRTILYMPHRYHSLQQPMQIRRDNLEDALLLHQFLRDVDDELQWLAEKQPQAASTDLGTSLTAVQSLQKKHQASNHV